ncbi:MAG: SPASM domain-containing protein, partial [Nanoarchaeota archaeon]|nr:SPASM domain-containing protein [Nanoarchaeota archaeon]
DLRFSLVSNLISLNDEMADFLMKERIGLCTSIDGCKIVHDKNRQGHDETANWIRKIKEKNYRINALLLITKHSLSYHKEIVNEYVNLGLDTIWVKALNKLGYAKDNWKEIGLTAEEFLSFWKKSLDYIVEINKNTLLKENSTVIILRKILKKKGSNFADLQSPCGACIAQLAYDYNGDIYTCDEGRQFDIFKVGTVDDKYTEILSSNETKSIVETSINDNPVCETCAYKPYCGLCPVCAYSETNNIITKLPDRRCKILKGQFDYIFEKLIFDENFRKIFFTWIE